MQQIIRIPVWRTFLKLDHFRVRGQHSVAEQREDILDETNML